MKHMDLKRSMECSAANVLWLQRWSTIPSAPKRSCSLACVCCHVTTLPVFFDCTGRLANLVAANNNIAWRDRAAKLDLGLVHVRTVLLGEARVCDPQRGDEALQLPGRGLIGEALGDAQERWGGRSACNHSRRSNLAHHGWLARANLQ